MPREKRKTITMFCDHCGETKTYFADDERMRPKSCKECLQGTMVEAVHTIEPDTH